MLAFANPAFRLRHYRLLEHGYGNEAGRNIRKTQASVHAAPAHLSACTLIDARGP
jgi:hypothetical protein